MLMLPIKKGGAECPWRRSPRSACASHQAMELPRRPRCGATDFVDKKLLHTPAHSHMYIYIYHYYYDDYFKYV